MRNSSLLLLCVSLLLTLSCEGASSEDRQGQMDAQLSPKDMALPDMPQAGLDLSAPPAEDMATGQDTSPLVQEMGADAGPDASAPGDAGADLGPEPVPLLLALGDFGRRTLSCDGGKTWVADTDFEAQGHKLVCGKVQSSRCYDDQAPCERTERDGTCRTQKSCDCDHHPATPMGLAWGQGWFVATYGWGAPGVVMRSRDGLEWEEVQDGKTHARVLHGQGTFVLGSPQMDHSSDQGATWTSNQKSITGTDSQGHAASHPRQGAFVDAQGGRFVFVMESGVANMPGVSATAALVSKDKGETWEQPDLWPDETCGKQSQGAVGGGGTLVITHASGKLCVSTDGAKTFVVVETTAKSSVSRPVFDGTRFHFWSRGTHHTSSDGLSWRDEPMVSPQPDLGAVAYNPATGTFAAVKGAWQAWYEKQRFLYSQDGTTWQELGPEDAKRGHRIRHIAFGWAPAGFVCPER